MMSLVDLVGRPGPDPGTSGLKRTVNRLRCVGLVAHIVCFQGTVMFFVGLVKWCCRNMRPKMRPLGQVVSPRQVDIVPEHTRALRTPPISSSPRQWSPMPANAAALRWSSVLKSPITGSTTALSRLSRTVPMEGAARTSAMRSPLEVAHRLLILCQTLFQPWFSPGRPVPQMRRGSPDRVHI